MKEAKKTELKVHVTLDWTWSVLPINKMLRLDV